MRRESMSCACTVHPCLYSSWAVNVHPVSVIFAPKLHFCTEITFLYLNYTCASVRFPLIASSLYVAIQIVPSTRLMHIKYHHASIRVGLSLYTLSL